MDSDASGRHTVPQGQPATILLVEDDPAVAMTLTDVLEGDGYRVTRAENGAAAKTIVDESPPDLIILDLMLPDSDGLVLCSDLKGRADVPIIICSATSRKRDAVLGFKLGADDFVAKPFQVDELLTRVQAALRRAASRPVAGAAVVATEAEHAAPSALAAQPGFDLMTHDEHQRGTTPRSYRVGDLLVDHARRSVRLGDASVELTPTEYRLVAALASRPEEVLSRQDLAQMVWGYQDASIGRSIDVHLHRLRTKLKDASSGVTPPQIVAVRGFGYKITETGNESDAA